jgi:hypothetical protein
MSSAFWFVRYRCSLDGVYFCCGLPVQTMYRLRLRPHGFIPDIAFGRKPYNSICGTFTHVDASFPGAHLNSEVEDAIPRSPGSRTFKSWNSATRSAVSQPTGLVRGSFLGEKSL